LSEKDTINLIKRLTLPRDFKLNEEETRLLIDGPSPPAIRPKKTQKSKAVGGKRSIKNVPDTLGNKKLNLPKTTKYRPGMLLPQSITMARTQRNIANIEIDSDDEDNTQQIEGIQQFQDARNTLDFGRFNPDDNDSDNEGFVEEEYVALHGFDDYVPEQRNEPHTDTDTPAESDSEDFSD
jgi:hypothetical protein